MTDNVYLGNPNLKKANTPIQFSQENILEFVRCKEDPVYFARKYIKIVSLDSGLIPFDLYDFQEKLIRNFHESRFNICKMPRQTVKSTTCVSYLLHYAVFNDNVNIAILASIREIVSVVDICVIAPMMMILLTALVTDISGVCSEAVTFQITM